MSSEDTQYDNRIVQHHIRRGALSEQDWQAYLDSLPDDAEHGVSTVTRFSSSYERRHHRTAEKKGEAAPQD